MQPVSPSKLSSSRGHEDPLCSAARRTPARATAFYDTIIKVRRAWVDYRSGAARPLLGYLERTRELFRTRRGDRTLRLSGCKWPLANVRSRPRLCENITGRVNKDEACRVTARIKAWG